MCMIADSHLQCGPVVHLWSHHSATVEKSLLYITLKSPLEWLTIQLHKTSTEKAHLGLHWSLTPILLDFKYQLPLKIAGPFYLCYLKGSTNLALISRDIR